LSSLGESGLQEALFAELAAGAIRSFAWGGPLSCPGAAYKYWRTPNAGAAKIDQCGNLQVLRGGLIDEANLQILNIEVVTKVWCVCDLHYFEK
jgi:hypothetical protein